jgi:hypothetical protein
MHFLREYDRVVLFHAYKTNKIVDFIQNTARIKIDRVVSTSYAFDDLVANTYSTWREFYENFEYDLGNEKIDDVYLFGAPLSDGGHLKRKHNGLEKNLDNNKFITFVSVAKHYFTAYAAIKVANREGASFIEICYDPGENSVGQLRDAIRPKDVNVFHGYDIPDLEIKKHHFYQDGLQVAFHPQHSHPTIFFDDFGSQPTFDLVFGYSYMNKERKATHEYFTKIRENLPSNLKTIFPVKNKLEDIDTSVSRNEYLSLLDRSRFTFVAPAYQAGCFSPFRFIEAVYYDCLPLVFETCNSRPFFESYDIDLETQCLLIVDPATVNGALAMSEHLRAQLLRTLREKIFNQQ